ncbi:DNALI1 [Bugula neritina]|uniref:DNALI1 n=1 Tax=Bugula neritina TaxID=10212 RepID=A0A7J7JEQ6_BUGNE|nr:DNALI1 [Bugula neritina]
MIPPNSSLVKYDNPVLVSRNTEKKTPKSRPLKVNSTSPQPGSGPVPTPPGKKLPPVDAKTTSKQMRFKFYFTT